MPPDLFDGSRLAAVSFSGTLPDYVRGVISAGRPVPSAGTSYPQRMPTWGQAYGGPLRSDQVDALVAYILNWKDRALAGGGAPPTPSGPVVGTDITASLPQGDAQRGKALAESGLGCSGCHILAAVGPAWIGTGGEPGIGTRAEQRFQAAGYSGKATSAEQYLFELIVAPNAFVEARLPAEHHAAQLRRPAELAGHGGSDRLHAQPEVGRANGNS